MRAILVMAMILAQQTPIPGFQIELGPVQRTSIYEYREQKDKGHLFLEMRLKGKEHWARVEEIKCEKIGQEWESQSFDYSGRCGFISAQ
jgi:hypothetical protein